MTTSPTTLADRLTDGLLVTIVLSVGLMAGAASFNHVHDWTMHNSPAHTAGWFGWANAVITELIPTAALIIIARRRRHDGPIAYPMFLLIVAIGLSLTAQLAVARPTVFGWMVSALPAAAFFALSKLVFTTTRPAPSVPSAGHPAVDPAPADVATVEARHHLATRVTDLETRPTLSVSALTPATDATTPSTEVPAVASARPAAKQTTAHEPSPRRTPATKTTPTTATPAAEPKSTPVSTADSIVDSTVDGAPSAPVVTEPTTTTKLLPHARIIAQAHHTTHGARITRGQLAVKMGIGTDLAEQILNTLGDIPTIPNTTRHNGTPTTGVPA